MTLVDAVVPSSLLYFNNTKYEFMQLRDHLVVVCILHLMHQTANQLGGWDLDVCCALPSN